MAKDTPPGGYSQWHDPDEFDDDSWTAIAESVNAAHTALLADPESEMARAIYREASATAQRARDTRQSAEGRDPKANVASGTDADGNPVSV